MRDRLDAVRLRVHEAALRAGRDPADVRIVAVTKGQSVAAVQAALAAGLRDIGENRVREAQAKHTALAGAGITWHMIGHLQQNKTAAAAALFDVVHSVDSARIATALARHRDRDHPLAALVEVDLTGLAARTGAEAAEADELVEVIASLGPTLLPSGLMTIAPRGPAAEARRCFAALRALRDRLRSRHGVQLADLSMGMSDDFEVAVEEGATIIRLGRVLFGEPPPLS